MPKSKWMNMQLAPHSTLPGYEVEEYSELDFEHVTLDSNTGPIVAECEACGTLNDIPGSGVWTCDMCSAINYQEIEL